MLKNNKGFTLIELLVVIAIIGVLSSIVLSSLATSRNRAGDAAIKTALSHLRTGAELYFNDQTPNTYGTQAFIENCSTAGTVVFGETKVRAQIADAVAKSGQTAATAAKCASGGTWYVVAVQLKSSSTQGWCVDNLGASRLITWANFVSGDNDCSDAI